MNTTNDRSLSVGGSDETDETVFRFHARQIRSHQGEHLQSILIDLDPSRHGLYDLIQTVLQFHRLPDLPTERILEQNWYGAFLLEFVETKYAYGLSHEQLPQELRHDGYVCCCATDRQVFNNLDSLWRHGLLAEMGFQIGMKGKFNRKHTTRCRYCRYPRVSFEFELVSIRKDKLDHIESYECGNDVTVQMAQEVANLRERYQVYKYYYHGYAYYRGRSVEIQQKNPPWNREEEGILLKLIASKCRFSKVWDRLLWYAFVNRTKSAVEQHYRILKKKKMRGYLYEDDDDESVPSPKEVKQDCLDRMHAFLQRGDPNQFPMLADVEHRYHIYWD